MSRIQTVAALVGAGLGMLSAAAYAAADAERLGPVTGALGSRLTVAQIAARQKFFGIENVNAATGAVKSDKVIFSWATNTTYAVSILGRVVLMDSYVTRLEVEPGRTPFVIQDLVDLKPEALFIGHGHFDHADNATYIAKKTNATIYASPEACDQFQADVTRMYSDPNEINGGKKIIADNQPVHCVPVVSRGSTPGTEVAKLTFLEPVACVLAFKHMHSASVPYDATYPAVTPNVTRDTRDAQMYPAGTPLTPPTNVANRVPGQIDTRTSTAGSLSVGGPIAIAYQVVLKRGSDNYFSFLWHNSAGPMKEGLAPDGNWGPEVGAGVFELFTAIPKTDLQLGSVSTAGLQTNAMRDVVMYSQYLQPQVFIPGHMTTGTNGVGESSSPEMLFTYKLSKDALGVAPTAGPELRWLVDPTDYLRPMVYTPSDARWNDPSKVSRVAKWCS